MSLCLSHSSKFVEKRLDNATRDEPKTADKESSDEGSYLGREGLWVHEDGHSNEEVGQQLEQQQAA